MRFRPCIDLHQGRVKQIVGSSYTDTGADNVVSNFDAECPPNYYAALYRDDGLAGGHVIMLGPGNEEAARNALAAYPGGLQIGGGMRPDNAAQWLEAGAAKVIVTSYVFRESRLDPSRLAEMKKLVGKERLVLDLSCSFMENAYFVLADRWQTVTDFQLNADTLAELAAECSELLVHAVDVEGKRSGVDETLVHLLGNSAPCPVTYAGGIRNMQDIYRIKDIGQDNVDFTVGSALDIFGGHIPYCELVALDRAERAGRKTGQKYV